MRWSSWVRTHHCSEKQENIYCLLANYTWRKQNFCAISLLEFVSKRPISRLPGRTFLASLIVACVCYFYAENHINLFLVIASHSSNFG